MLALLSALILVAGPGDELNAQGEALCKPGHYREALELFRQATEVNPKLGVAYFNQARAMALMRQNPHLRVRPTKKDVLDAAEQAVQVDPKLRERLDTLPAVKTTFRGQRLLGHTVEKNTAEILQGILWHSRSGNRLEFLPGGKVTQGGTWSVDGARVRVTFGGRQYEGQIDSEGVLNLGALGRFFDW